MLADSRAIEARRERGRAESERESAIARYRSVRSLATAILNDVNDSLRDLPGSAPARRKAVLAALQHLEGLSERSASDPELTRDVANAYEEMAEIMLSSFDEAREGASLAIPALLKAVRLRTPLLHAEAPVELANSQRLLGNAYLAAAQPQPAITAYTQALAAAKRADLIPAGRRLTAIVHSNLCLARAEIGAVKDAWPDCQASVAAAIEAGPAIDPELREALLLRAWRTARAAQRAEAKELRDSLVSLLDPFDAEGVKLLEELATDPPRDVAAHRLAMKLGVARMREGKRVVALQRFAEAAQDAEAQPEQFAEAALAAMHAVHEVRNGRTRQAMQLREQALGLLAGCTSRGANLLRNDLAAAFTAAETASTPRSHN
jgi:tetratricopeptide (TPR) repeat protein